MTDQIAKYGCQFDASFNPLEIELWMIRNGKRNYSQLFEHYMEARRLLWPERYRHRWTDIMYKATIENIVTILMGPGSSQKSSFAAEFSLISYWAKPDNTLILVSTTTTDKLDSAIFGEIKMLFNDARDRWDFLDGNVLESKRMITTDSLEIQSVRDVRKGFLGKPCYSGHRYVGLGVYAGIKQENIIFVADELQFMQSTFFDCLPNMFQSAGLDSNGDPSVKVIGSGNPNHDPEDQLSIAAEPEDGWASLGDVTKTTVWKNKFYRGVTVNLIGLDSPNFDVPEGVRPPFPRLISRNTVKLVVKRWGTNSPKYYSQCVGKMMFNMQQNRVVTMLFCEQHRAFEKAFWKDDAKTRIGFLDPAWGGDRCVWGWLEFGYSMENQQIIRFGEHKIVPFVAGKVETDDQIAQFVQREARSHGVKPADIFYDSTGKGTTGAAFARVFGSEVPVPVAFGEKPTRRMVRHDLMIFDEALQIKRHKRCDEEYSKFVTELWFAARNVIECEQMRELPEEIVREGAMREYYEVPGGKVEVEPKDEMKERIGFSPDLFDAFVVGIEGARQRGFNIGRLGEVIIENQEDEDFFDREAKEWNDAIKKGLLNHAVL